MEDFNEKLRIIERDLKELKEECEQERIENKKQNQRLKEITRKNQEKINASAVAAIGAICAFIFMIMQIDTKTEKGQETLTGITNQIIEVLPLIIAGGSGGAALMIQNKNNRGNINDDD